MNADPFAEPEIYKARQAPRNPTARRAQDSNTQASRKQKRHADLCSLHTAGDESSTHPESTHSALSQKPLTEGRASSWSAQILGICTHVDALQRGLSKQHERFSESDAVVVVRKLAALQILLARHERVERRHHDGGEMQRPQHVHGVRVEVVVRHQARHFHVRYVAQLAPWFVALLAKPRNDQHQRGVAEEGGDVGNGYGLDAEVLQGADEEKGQRNDTHVVHRAVQLRACVVRLPVDSQERVLVEEINVNTVEQHQHLRADGVHRSGIDGDHGTHQRPAVHQVHVPGCHRKLRRR
mmetsp:Transcript_58201/g.188385  ORF Transcript_58201/g.188385 Transcript_58201/m.188385 type:complete len:296 (-) Transcript_58201:1910-2797(-)